MFEVNGNKREAMNIAGYSPTTKFSQAFTPFVMQLIIERAQAELTSGAPQAVSGLLGILTDPTKPGNRELLAATTAVLDRIGLAKQEKVKHEVEAPNGIFILPEKRKNDNE